MIEKIERLEDGNYMVVVDDQETAKVLLKRNPNCHTEIYDSKWVLVYGENSVNAAIAIRPPR